MRGELLNNTSKLTETNRRIQRDTKKLEEIENDPTDTNEQGKLSWERLDDLNTKKEERLEILSKNRIDLQNQLARIKKETIAKVLDQDTSLAKRIRTLFREQGRVIFSILTALALTISTIVLAVIEVFGGGGAAGDPPPKDEGRLDRIANALKRFAEKALKLLKLLW